MVLSKKELVYLIFIRKNELITPKKPFKFMKIYKCKAKGDIRSCTGSKVEMYVSVKKIVQLSIKI